MEHRDQVPMIEDTGIGIPDDDLPRLFERFHRGRNAASHPGSGLGLAIVLAIVEAHGGDVAVEKRSVGASFTVSLPRTTNSGLDAG
jgi:signal transduction histidine kinase